MRNRRDHRLEELNREREAREESPWAEYERRKAEIAQTAETAREYERRVAELAEELGL